MIDNIKKTLSILTPEEKRKGMLLIVIMIIMAVMETIGVVSIMPFMAVLANPTIIETNKYINFVYTNINFESQKSFLFFLGGLVFFFLIFGNIIRALSAWAQARYTNMRGHYISKRLMKIYLLQNYLFFVDRNSGDIANNILSEASGIVSGTLVPLMNIIARSIVSFFLVLTLFIAEPFLATTVSLIIGASYFVIYKIIKLKMVEAGNDRLQANKERHIIINEAFGGVKDVKLLGLEREFIRRYNEPSERLSKHKTFYQVASQIPKFILEILSFGSVLMITLYLMATQDDLSKVIPMLVLYAFAGYKLMPAMQEIFTSIANLKFNDAVINSLHNEFSNEPVVTKYKYEQEEINAFNIINNIRLKNISFKYPNCDNYANHNINLTIKSKTSVGFVGSTGSGKTTLIDIILGLLKPTEGELLVNDITINLQNCRLWQNKLGYVPQAIYLTDDSVAKNIAFGVEEHNVEMDKVIAAAKMANLHDFIESEMPEKYQTIVGERGIRLSGGQRQRIGIARALYRDPEVLILDEATSALDNITEKTVMEAIKNLTGLKTLIIIAHRLSTLQNSDVIHFMEHGEIIASGTYNELVANNATFANMVKISKT